MYYSNKSKCDYGWHMSNCGLMLVSLPKEVKALLEALKKWLLVVAMVDVKLRLERVKS